MLLVASVIVCAVMIYWIADGGWRTWKSLRLLLGAASLVPEDISQRRPDYPDILSQEVSELKAQGFRRLGEFELRPPQFRDPLTTWVFIEKTRTLIAELTWGRSRWHMNSYFDDGAWLVTDLPRGESNQAPGFMARTIQDTPSTFIASRWARLPPPTRRGGNVRHRGRGFVGGAAAMGGALGRAGGADAGAGFSGHGGHGLAGFTVKPDGLTSPAVRPGETSWR